MTGLQLKNSILQLAIQGKLVPQDPNDEPASVLLEKIRKEKVQMVKDGKLKKKDLETTPISEDEKPFEIPESWVWCRLGGVLDVRDGTHDSPKYYGEGFPLVTSKNLKNGVIDFSSALLIKEDDYIKINERSRVDDGDILYAMIGSIGNPVIVRKDRDFAIKNMALFKKINNGLFMKYAYHFLTIAQYSMREYASGGVQSFVSLGYLRNYIIPLPPLAEQKRIVAKIEELLPLVEEYDKAQKELDALNTSLPEALKKSILQEAIQGKLVPQDPNDEPASVLLEKIRKEKEQLVKDGKLKKKDLINTPISDDEKPFEIPENWEWCRLGDIGSWGSGATPSKGKPEYYTNGNIPWLRTGELNNDYVYDSEIKVTQLALDDCSLRMCSKGDVLMAMYGATIGKVAIAGIDLTTNQACCACTPIQIFNEYLMWYLMASKQAFIELGEGGAQPNISREKIIVFPFAVPPLSEQHRIVAKIEELFKAIDNLKVS